MDKITDTFTAAPQSDKQQFIAVEGVIGAGKTSLARLLAEKTNAKLVLEAFDENPFLAKFYEDADRWSFHTQLSFLASRFQQQKEVSTPDLFHNTVISDYTFDKDRIFAHQTLAGDELHLYETLYRLMETTIRQPDLVVYLESDTDRLMQNIEGRGREYEQQMERSYLESLHSAYTSYFQQQTNFPVLIIHTTNIDFVHNEKDRADVLTQILRKPEPGIRYYRPHIDDVSTLWQPDNLETL